MSCIKKHKKQHFFKMGLFSLKLHTADVLPVFFICVCSSDCLAVFVFGPMCVCVCVSCSTIFVGTQFLYRDCWGSLKSGPFFPILRAAWMLKLNCTVKVRFR